MIDHMTQYQTEFTLKLGIILGLVFTLIYIVLSYFLRKLTLKTIEKELEKDEFIECEGKVKWWERFIPFALGLFTGGFIIPFIIFPDVQRIDTIDRQNFFWCILAELIGIAFIPIVASWKCVFTNKRMINRCIFKLLNKFKFFGDEFIIYSDIMRMEYNYHIWIKVLYFVLKSKRYYRVPLFENMKEVQSTIGKYIGGE